MEWLNENIWINQVQKYDQERLWLPFQEVKEETGQDENIKEKANYFFTSLFVSDSTEKISAFSSNDKELLTIQIL